MNSLLLYTLKACEEDRNKKLLADSMPFVSSLQKYDRYIGEIAENMGDPEVSEVEEDAGEEEQEGVRVEGVPEKNIKNPCACEDCTEDGVIPHVFESKVETEAKDKRWSCVSHFWSKKNKGIKTLVTKTLGSLRKINKAILKNGFGPEDAIAVGPTALSMLQDNIHEILTIIDEVKQEEDSEHESPMETDERLDGEAEEGEEEEEQRSPRKKKRRQKAVKVVERGENQERIDSFFKSV